MVRFIGLTGLIFLMAGPVSGQEEARLSFEVASIKPAKPAGTGGASSSRSTPGRVEFHAVSLRDCVGVAYRVSDYQINAPAWMREKEWDIVAKLPEGAPSSQMPQMLQILLASRFKLQVHRETKDFPGLALVVTSGGPKLKNSDENPGAKGRGGFRFSTGPNGGHMMAPRANMTMLASTIAVLLRMPVVDETHLSGTYNLDLEYAQEDAANVIAPAMPPAAEEPANAAAPPRPSIFSSLQKLGLRLESQKIPLDVIVVDHAEKTPTEN